MSGLARARHAIVHAEVVYDLFLSGTLPGEDNAEVILRAVRRLRPDGPAVSP